MEVVYATYTAQVVTPDGGRHTVHGGQHWHPRHPVVLAAPEGLFSPDARYGLSGGVPPELDEPPVEQATAGPGEKRATRRG
jgi:hypothetical protein